MSQGYPNLNPQYPDGEPGFYLWGTFVHLQSCGCCCLYMLVLITVTFILLKRFL